MNASKPAPINFLSFDVEHGIQTFKERGIPFRDYKPNGEIDFIYRLLELLAETKNTATFFVLTSEVKNYEGILTEALKLGHQIASHGHDHIRIFKRSPSEFKSDVKLAKSILENTFQIPIKGYRAPGFSLNHETSWAVPIISEAGYVYSSSTNFKYNLEQGKPEISDTQFNAILKSNSLIDFPSTSLNLKSLNQRIIGGFYSRLLPISLQETIIEMENKRKLPVNLYSHPFEFDLQAPRIFWPPFASMIRYFGLHKNEMKFEYLIRKYRFSCFENFENLNA